ncbi:hypothetical protein [Winogradskyella sp. UBA3174]|uniref:hypothetical protein n=1 Tax=Winogradskyella sp. UBA3174 TaxID=1947785 RepID=UPI0025FDEBD6|nr:hypothetical protein [Winogradskyella sp. UBA3174]|tara:strand:+ start:21476 stop:22276 length:801 start_codon:yes stop_codon:yes gene_type:complete
MRKIRLLSLIIITTMSSCKEDVNRKESEETKDKISIKEGLNEIHFFTTDSIKIYGDLYKQSNTAPTLLIFHQAGSNAKAEYNSILPELEKQGFNILTIDQRVGGNHFHGGTNRTVNEIKNKQYNYCDVYPDLVAALAYMKNSRFNGKIIIWGSSYSGSLAIKLANENQDIINGVLAFSPASGGPMEACKPDAYFESLKLPLLLLRPFSEMQSRQSQAQFDLAKQYGHQTYIAQNGAHGSSMLDARRVEGSTVDNWKTVNTFLQQFK